MKLLKIIWMEDTAQQCFIWVKGDTNIEMHLERHIGYLPSWWHSTEVVPIEGGTFN